mmetsp:Transcript_1121/g.2633  ORF Transcript_1121/g.2633 Transcript_1121/m.2633 type:complete len:109 (+) Transcript_1121:636-962(+)
MQTHYEQLQDTNSGRSCQNVWASVGKRNDTFFLFIKQKKQQQLLGCTRTPYRAGRKVLSLVPTERSSCTSMYRSPRCCLCFPTAARVASSAVGKVTNAQPKGHERWGV